MIRPMKQIPGQERLIPGGEPAHQGRWIPGQPLFLCLGDGLEVVWHGGKVVLFPSAVEVVAPEVPVVEVE